MSMELKFKDCDACGNFLVPKNKKYCSGCWEAIKAKEKLSGNVEKRLARLENQVKKLMGK